jgi:hypothetical protein
VTVYILEIPGSEFTGFMGGVDFCKGKGSTSSRADALLLAARNGCRIVEPASEIKDAGAGPPAPIVIPEKIPEKAEAPVYASRADRKQRERAEQIFEPNKKGKRGK